MISIQHLGILKSVCKCHSWQTSISKIHFMRDKRDEDGITLAWVAGVKRGGGGVGGEKTASPFFSFSFLPYLFWRLPSRLELARSI